MDITAGSDSDDIVRAAARLSESFHLDCAEAATSLADLVQEMAWLQESDRTD